jgi:hypothetical protein
MELSKLQKEKEEFTQRLTAVIDGAIRTHIADGGIHPAEIDVHIITKDVFGKGRDYVLAGVTVNFGL